MDPRTKWNFLFFFNVKYNPKKLLILFFIKKGNIHTCICMYILQHEWHLTHKLLVDLTLTNLRVTDLLGEEDSFFITLMSSCYIVTKEKHFSFLFFIYNFNPTFVCLESLKFLEDDEEEKRNPYLWEREKLKNEQCQTIYIMESS